MATTTFSMENPALSVSKGPITALLRDQVIEVHHFSTVRNYELLPDSVCWKCSGLLSRDPWHDASLCWWCNEHDDLYGFDQAFAMARYDKNPKSHLVKDIRQKYHNNKNGSYRMGVALALFIRQFLPDFRGAGAIIPAPMHPERREERGFNQAELIADQVSGILGIPVLPNVLTKVKREAQIEFETREERRENVKGMFAHVPIKSSPEWVVFVDDLISTGFTAAECCQQLLDAGASLAYGLAAGRTMFAEGGT